MRRSLAAVVVLVLAVVAGAVAARSQPDPRPALAQAVAAIPADTGTASFTDWKRVRGTGKGAGARRSVGALMRRAYAHDLTSVSVVASAQQEMAEQMGWSALDLDWEMYSQSRRGAVLVLALSPSTRPARVVRGLRRAGYTPPTSRPSGGGVWETNGDVAANVPGLPDQLANVAVLADRGLVLGSDRGAFLRRSLGVVRGARASFADTRAARDLARTLAPVDVAVLHDSASGCASTSYEDAAPADRNQATALAGGALEATRGLALGLRERHRTQHLRVAMRFGSTVTAERQMAVRRRLATGDAVGQGGTFGERFDIARARTSGTVGVLDLRLRSPRTQAFSDLDEGPLLFAWCGR